MIYFVVILLKDVIIGFDFAPLVYENEDTGILEVDLGLVNDVREQRQGHGEDLRQNGSAEDPEDSRRGSNIIKQSTASVPVQRNK